jgi:DMSO reductase anchor subunit
MCHSRLAVGEAPACVQACPTSAIRIRVVEQAKVRANYRPLTTFKIPSGSAATSRNNFLAASPNPAITLPTTRFVTQRTFPENLFAGDQMAVRRSEAHLPLATLLILSQLAIGASIAALFVSPSTPLLLMALAAGVVALAAGSLHLGQPLKAWRSFLGWRNSWFSREVIALSAFVFLIALASGAAWFSPAHFHEKLLAPFAAVSGALTVACSAMIYVKTRREFWSATQTFSKFFGTVLLLGTATAFAISTPGKAPFAAALAILTVTKLAIEHNSLKYLVDAETPEQTPLNKTARLLAGELNSVLRMRIAFGVIGGVIFPIIALSNIASGSTINPFFTATVLALCVVGEFIERYLFFTAVVTQKMPGGLAS